MKHARIHFPNLSYIAAFVIGVILFASFWKTWFGSASSSIVLAGMAGVAVAVTIFWLRNEFKNSKDKDNNP
jgi:glucan phosphoethanolaminetransferase (alkaline phosphatase superfamily)